MSEVLRRQARNDPDYRPGRRWEPQIHQAVDQAKADGDLRSDAAGTDIALLPFALAGLTTMPEPIRSLLIARHTAVLLDGLRAEGRQRSSLPGAPASVDDFHRAAHRITAGSTRPSITAGSTITA